MVNSKIYCGNFIKSNNCCSFFTNENYRKGIKENVLCNYINNGEKCKEFNNFLKITLLDSENV